MRKVALISVGDVMMFACKLIYASVYFMLIGNRFRLMGFAGHLMVMIG